MFGCTEPFWPGLSRSLPAGKCAGNCCRRIAAAAIGVAQSWPNAELIGFKKRLYKKNSAILLYFELLIIASKT